MKCKCNKCGIEFEDNYKEVNELNKRLWCNKCVKELCKMLHRRPNGDFLGKETKGKQKFKLLIL